MSSNASAAIGAIQRDLFGLQRSVDLTTGKLNSMKLAAVGAMSALAGAAALKGLGSLINASKELVHQQSLLRLAAVSNAEIGQASAAAWRIAADVQGTGVADNMKMLADLRNVMGSMDHAIQVAPSMAKIGVVLQSVTGKPGEEAAYQFARFLELRGALIDPITHQISPERLEGQMRMGTAIIAGTRGRVGPAELLAFQQQARAAGAMLNDEGLLDAVPLIQASGGFRAGTMMAAITQQLTGGVMTQRSGQWLVEHGLLPASALHIERGGKVVIDKNRLAGSDTLAADPGAWATSVLMPKLQAQGYQDQDALTKVLLQSGLRQTTTGGLVEFVRNSASFSKEVANIRRAMGVDQYGLLFGHGMSETDGRRDRDSYDPRVAVKVDRDPNAGMEAFSKAFDNLLKALGKPLMEPALEILARITGTLTDWSQWAAKNEGTVLIMGEIAAAVGGVALAFGAFAVGTAAASALGLLTGATGLVALAAGITAAGTALGVLPSWVVTIAAGGTAGAAIGSRFGPAGAGIGAAIGAAAGLGVEIGTGARRLYDSSGVRPPEPGAYPLNYPNQGMLNGYAPPTSGSQPLRVTIDNADELAGKTGSVAANGTVSRIERGLSRQSTGTSGFDPRMSAPGMFAP